MLKYSATDNIKNLTIQVVAPAHFIEPLKVALLMENDQKYNNELQFSFCENVEEGSDLQRIFKKSPDLFAIVLEPKFTTCLETAEENIKKIDKVFISGGRVCLVNGSCSAKYSDLGVGFGAVNVLSQKYSCILINGDVMIPDKCQYLASRIIELARAVSGCHTGSPVVLDFPGFDSI